MARTISILLLCSFLAWAAYANVPEAPRQEDVSIGYVDPVLGPWGLDVVSWAVMAASPQLLGRSASGILGNYMYVFGAGNAINAAQAFNLTTELWEASTPPPLGYDNWAGVATNDAIYIVGRYSGPYGAEIQKFTPTGGGPTGTWANVAPYPVAFCGGAAAWDGGDYIYAAGGNPAAAATAANRYSISGNTWSALAPMPLGRAYCGGAFVQGKFYVLGGTVAAAANTMVAYDPVGNTWSSTANLPTNVWFGTFSTTFDNGRVMSIGGGGGYGSWPATDAVQLYDPTTNTWTLDTPLPAAWGCNSARSDGADKVISTGGYNGVAWTGVTHRGTGFAGGGTPPDITITMVPESPPIVIPVTGGSFNWTGTVTNNEATSETFDVWVMVTLPNGSQYGPVLGPLSLTLGGGASLSRLRTQTVPASAPPGNYTYTGNVGSYPGTVYDSDSFPFSKSAADHGGTWVGEWANSGQSFEASATVIPAEFSLQGARPNPFNPTTTLSFVLPEAAKVTLSVFDISGRQVATLVNGWRDAGSQEVIFDGSALASGVYLYRLSTDQFSAVEKMVLMK